MLPARGMWFMSQPGPSVARTAIHGEAVRKRTHAPAACPARP